MEVRLSDEAAAIIARRVAEGWYADEHEAVEAAVAMLAGPDVDLDDWIRAHSAEIQEGLDEIDRGETRELAPDYFDRLRERIRKHAPVD